MDDTIDKLLNATDTIPQPDVTEIVQNLGALLQSGEENSVRKADVIVKKLKEKKLIDWNSHVEEIESILLVIGSLTKKQLQSSATSGHNGTILVYLQFTRMFLEQLKRCKVLSRLQESLLKFVFSCMTIDSPLKTQLAAFASDEKYLNLSKHKLNRIEVLQKCEIMFTNKTLPLDNHYFGKAFNNVLVAVIKSYNDNGKEVTAEENDILISIFKKCGEIDALDEFYSDTDEYDSNGNEDEKEDRILSIYGKVYKTSLLEYIQLHQATETLGCITPIIPDVLKWAKIAVEEGREEMDDALFSILSWVGQATPPCLKDKLTDIIDLMLFSDYATYMHSLVEQLYPHNPEAVHAKLPEMFDKAEGAKSAERQIYVAYIFYMVAQSHAGVFTQSMISKLLDLYPIVGEGEKPVILLILRAIAEKNSSVLVEFLPRICDDNIFEPESLNVRTTIISAIGSVSEALGQKAIDYFMKFVDHSDPTVSHVCIGYLSTLTRDHIEYMQRYKSTLENVKKTHSIAIVRELVHHMLLKLEGKTVENLVENVQDQQAEVSELDEKVTGTMNVVTSIGEKVVEHDKEIGDLESGFQAAEERMDNVEQDMGKTMIQVKSIDEKTLSNAPKWAKDLAKLMNKPADNDWRLIASRLAYSNDDIRSWATLEDPSLALLNKWFETHKTSEATLTVLTTLKEINRMDGVAIVENAMKKAEGITENEAFEYANPPPVFISYQWGIQQEVKLLKQHLNMAGYECWMDIGQMGGGDKLFAKIDKGIRDAKVVICCVTKEYSESPNCKREVNLAVNLRKPMIPLLMEKTDWPPKGSMGPIFGEYLFIRFYQRQGEETPENDNRYWPVANFKELLKQLYTGAVPDKTVVHKDYSNWWSLVDSDTADISNRQNGDRIPKLDDTSENSNGKTLSESKSEVVKVTQRSTQKSSSCILL